MSKINITGINFDNVTLDESIELVKQNLNDSVRTIVYTPNAEIAYACIENKEYLDIINSANIILPDGDGVVEASKILNTPLKCKTPGVEFGYKLLKYCSENGLKVYLLGGKQEIVQKAKEELTNDLQGLIISGYHDGYFDNDESVINNINDSDADVILVCLGFPKQEKWVYENINSIPNIKVAACLGGSIDIYSKEVKRAPVFFRKLKLEWFYRTVKDPKRIKRISVIPKYLSYVRKTKPKI